MVNSRTGQRIFYGGTFGLQRKLWHCQADWLAYLQAQLRDPFESEWRGREGGSRVLATRQ
jgi:hypothetical protein